MKLRVLSMAVAVLWPALCFGVVSELSVQGTLLAADGSGLDGTFELTFKFHDASTGGSELWTETQTDVVATSGFFDVALGADVLNPITSSIFADNPQVWLGITVEAGPGLTEPDPELDRTAFGKVGAAFVADLALDSNTVGGKSSDDIKSEILQTVDDAGYLQIGAPLDQSNMPANGLNEVSNDLISNQFVDEVVSVATPLVVDSGTMDTIEFPDIGFAEKLTVSVNISTSGDLALVAINLIDPKGTMFSLYDKDGAGNAFAATFPDPTPTKTGDLTSWVGKNPKGDWTLQVIDTSLATGATLNSWSIKLSTLSNKKVLVSGNLIVDGTITGVGGTTIDGDLSVTGNANFGDGATISGTVTFDGRAEFLNGWCPSQPNGERSLVAGGVCVATIFGRRTAQSGASSCATIKADVCTDSQSWVMRAHGLLQDNRDGSANANWTNSFGGDDGSHFRDATGNTGDNHGPSNDYVTPCCYNATPDRDTDTTVGNVRVIHVHNANDVPFGWAAAYCANRNADLCSKAQYQVMRDQGVITARMWANDHSDNDGNVCSSSIGSVSDDPQPRDNHGFACCATSYKEPESIACPATATETGGVCWAKVNNSGASWNTAVNDCDQVGAQLCSITQNYVLRSNGIVTGSGNWTNSHSDNDSSNWNWSLNGGSDNPTNGQSYHYACCL